MAELSASGRIGAAETSGEASRLASGLPRQVSRERRSAALGRKRMMGGAGRLPHGIRARHSEGQRAALTVVAIEVKRQGRCDLPVDEIAARAGVSRRTVQYALRDAEKDGHISVTYRPQRGRKSLPNLVHIVAPEWLAWLRFEKTRRQRPQPKGIGCKEVRTTEKEGNRNRFTASRSDREGGNAAWLWTGKGRADRAQPQARERRSCS